MAGQGELAREVRVGLTVLNGGAGKASPKTKLDELFFKRPIRVHVLEFAALFATIFNLIGIYQLYFGQPITVPLALALCSLLLYAVGRVAPAVLYPVWSGWMTFAHYLGIFMTGLILFLAWSIALIPIAILLKIMRIRVMNVEFKQPVESYWETRDKKHNDFKLLERQF